LLAARRSCAYLGDTTTPKEHSMNTDQVKGKLKEAAGGAQKHVGRATGDADQEAKGAANETGGKVQKKVGDVKSGARKILKKP
jgi:uncharacterized protein YjbJ (UPF0337 family)